jgi:hypothetical protein
MGTMKKEFIENLFIHNSYLIMKLRDLSYSSWAIVMSNTQK